ncbi:hypothetical protein JTB14_001237 [Gonioctena quinquepunctata]|nr:hypothetical protein JTB14_001237 [Gonioctena quinquepunctata]
MERNNENSTGWTNYEHIVSNSTQKSCAKGGRPRKGNTNRKDDVTSIRDAALQIINENIEVQSVTIVPVLRVRLMFHQMGQISREITIMQMLYLYQITQMKEDTQSAKYRFGKNDYAFLYVAENAILENEVKKEQLRLERQKHEDSLELQRDELFYKKGKLELWMEEAEQRKLNYKKKFKLHENAF